MIKQQMHSISQCWFNVQLLKYVALPHNALYCVKAKCGTCLFTGVFSLECEIDHFTNAISWTGNENYKGISHRCNILDISKAVMETFNVN